MSQVVLPSGIPLSIATIPAGQTDQLPDSSSIIVIVRRAFGGTFTPAPIDSLVGIRGRARR